MGVSRVFRKSKPKVRPRKSGSIRKRRELEHKRRLIKVGMSEEQLKHMSAPQMRLAIRKAQKVGKL